MRGGKAALRIYLAFGLRGRSSYRVHWCHALGRTVCPSGLRGWTQVPLAQAAWVQIPQLSRRMFALIHALHDNPSACHAHGGLASTMQGQDASSPPLSRAWVMSSGRGASCFHAWAGSGHHCNCLICLLQSRFRELCLLLPSYFHHALRKARKK